MMIHSVEQPMQKQGLEIPGTEVTLDALFSGAAPERLAGKTRKLTVQIISHGGVPRWVLPENTRRAMTVLKSWKPYKAKSRAQWNAIVGSCRLNVLAALPGVTRETLHYDPSYWRRHVPGYSDSWEVVAYIGNPFPTRKALLFFVDEEALVQAVAKVPIYPAAKAAILNEARILTKLCERLPLPRVLFLDREEGIAAQTWIEGVNIPRRFDAEHLDLLTGFMSARARVRLSDCREALEERVFLLQSVDHELLRRALLSLDVRDELKACVEHGDFVPWNLRRLADGRLTLIDWEWAVEEGYPWEDVCRYFYLQDFLFREGADVWKTLRTNPLLREYRRRFELSPDAVRGLTLRYLLRYLCEEHAEGNQERVEYAERKIREILDSSK
jgi:hypothetical protein